MRSYLDLIDRLRAYIGNDQSSHKSAAVIRSAYEAVEKLPLKHSWQFYSTYAKLITSASYNTGTVAYDHTGGAAERLLTLTGGTFPTWVGGYGTIVLSGVHYDIATRLSSTTAQLKSDNNPGDDIAAGTTYTIYRNRYDLPADFASMTKPIMANDNRVIEKVPIDDFVRRRNWNDGVGTPYMFTLIQSGYGREQLMFWCPPGEVTSCEFQYRRIPLRPLVVEANAGTIATTNGSLTVTGTATEFSQAMVGGVLRVSYDAKPPTAFDSVTPPQYEYRIESVESATSLTLAEAATATVTKRGYTISSRLDVAEGPMFNFLVQMAMKNLRVNLRIDRMGDEVNEYERAEKEAREQDGQNYMGPDVAGTRGMFQGVAGRGLSYMRNT